MVAATATAPRLSIAPEAIEPTPEDEISRAIELWENGNNLLLDAGRVFAETKAGNKRKFNKLVENAHLEKTQVNKLIKMAEIGDEVPSAVAPRLGIHILIKLGQTRNEVARDAIAFDDTQLSVAQKIKELRVPAQPKEVKPVRFVGNQKGAVGRLRIEVPGCPEAIELERDWKESGLPPLRWLQSKTSPPPIPSSSLLCVVQSSKDSAQPTSIEKAAAQEEPKLEPQTDVTIAPTTDSQTQTFLPLPTNDNPTEKAVAQVELNAYVETQAEVIAPETVNPEPEELSTTIETQTTSYSPDLPTERYKKGWQVGDQAIANTVGGYFASWCEGKPATIESVQGGVGEIQILHVVRHDGAKDMPYGNWIEEILGASLVDNRDANESGEIFLYQVVETKNEWDSEVVKLETAGTIYHKVSFLDDPAWTNIKPQFLRSLSSTQAAAAQDKAELAQQVLANFGLAVEDTINWQAGDCTLTRKITRLTKLGAFIDEGYPGQTWIEYKRLKKVQVEFTPDVPEEATTLDYVQLSDALKKAGSWSEIEKLVDRNGNRLTGVVCDWTAEEKHKLINQLINYLKTDPDALVCHQVDWVSQSIWEKALEVLIFKARDIMGGLTAPWLNGCQFLKVEDFGKQTEEWTFTDSSNNKIQVYERKDFAVVAF